MSDAPERIWAYPMAISSGVPDWGEGGWFQFNENFPFETEYVRADLFAATLARAEKAEAELAKMADPNAVHVSMLAGTIAKPSWQQIKHVYAEETGRAEAALAEAVEAAHRVTVTDAKPEYKGRYADLRRDIANLRAILAAIPPAAPWTPPEDRPDGYRCWAWWTYDGNDGRWYRAEWHGGGDDPHWWVFGVGFCKPERLKHFLPEPPAPEANP